MNLWDELPHPTIIAHRGASAYAPENTLEAFRLAIAQKAHAIELDAKLTHDKQVVIFHDQRLGRTAAGSARIRDVDLATLEALDASRGFAGGYAPTHIPTLAQVLAAIAPHLPLNIELTNYDAPFDDLPQRVAELVERAQATQRVWFSSFNPIALHRIARRLPQVPRGFLVSPTARGRLTYRLFAPFISHQAVHPHASLVNVAWVWRHHRRGKRIFVYTVNRPAVMRRLFALGVDGIFTDDPLLAQRVLETESRPRRGEKEEMV